MSRQVLRDGQTSYAGGLNLTADPSKLGENQLALATNCRLIPGASIQKRGGSRRLHASALGSGNIVRGLYAWRKAASQELLAVVNGALNVGAYAMPTAWTAKAGAMANNVQVGIVAFRDGTGEVAYIGDGGPLNKYDGTNVTVNIANSQSCVELEVYNQRLFGITGNDQTIYYSTLNNGDSLGYVAGGGGSAIVRTFSNQKLTAIKTLGSSLLMWHVTGISRFTGYTQDDIAIASGAEGVSGSEGTIAPKSVVVVADEGQQDMAYFLTTRGLFVATEAGVRPVSLEIEQALSQLDQSSFARVCAAHHRQFGELWFYLPDAGIYVWNYRVGAWCGPYTGQYTSHLVYAAAEALDTQSRPIALVGGQDGFVRQADYPDTFLDDVLSDGTGGSRFTWNAKLHRLYFGDPTVDKSTRGFFVTGNLKGSNTCAIRVTTPSESEQMTLEGAAVSAGVGDTWDGATPFDDGGVWDASDRPETIPAPVSVRGTYVDVEFIDDAVAQPLISLVQGEAYNLNRRWS